MRGAPAARLARGGRGASEHRAGPGKGALRGRGAAGGACEDVSRRYGRGVPGFVEVSGWGCGGDGTGKGLFRTAGVWERVWGGMGVMADLNVTSARFMKDVDFLGVQGGTKLAGLPCARC